MVRAGEGSASEGAGRSTRPGPTSELRRPCGVLADWLLKFGLHPHQASSPMSDTEPTAFEKAAMREAVDRALTSMHQSGKAGIAATILLDGKAVATGENEVALHSDPTRHAEMVALSAAAKALGTTDLSRCVMISTLQPCEMCLAAMRFARIDRVVFGATQEKVAAKYFVFAGLSLIDFQTAGHPFAAIGGQFEDELLPLYIDGQE